MQKSKIVISLFFTLLFSVCVKADYEVGKMLPELVLKNDDGGHLDGSEWSSKSMLGHVAIFYYVDPDEKEKNDELSKALKERSFPRDQVKSYALINMAATWLPNFAISSALESSQKKYPHTVYLKDFQKVGVKKWELADDENNVVIFDQEGKVVFSKFGQLSQEEIKAALQAIEQNIVSNES